MNLTLIDPFVLAQDYPDTLTEKLSTWISISYHMIVNSNCFQEADMQPVYDLITMAII